MVLKGVVLAGDLPLDRLSLEPFEPGLIGHPAIVERIQSEQVSEVRVIHGPFMLEDVEVQGILATNLIKSGYMVVRGPVSLRGSTIQQSMDLSRMVFLERADFSDMHIGHEGFFIRAMFARDADFSRTAFGTHSRFHQVRFLGKAAFTGAGFKGLAELLEVSFAEDAEFGRTRFFQGTGFSGSRFHKTLNLSGSRFDREVYFRFTEFRGHTDFHRALFRNTVDFTEARFQGDVDFRDPSSSSLACLPASLFPSLAVREDPPAGTAISSSCLLSWPFCGCCCSWCGRKNPGNHSLAYPQYIEVSVASLH